MKTVKKLLRSANINTTNLFQIELLEVIEVNRNLDTLFINILINNKVILTSKPISMKLMREITSGNFTNVKEAVYLLNINNKIKKDDKKTFNVIKSLFNL